MEYTFRNIELRVAPTRFENWAQFVSETPEYSIGLEVMDDVPGHRGHHVHFDHHAGVVREATMSAAMQAYLAVRQGRLMERWLQRRKPVPVYVWNADQDVCLAAFVLEHHELLERSEGAPLLRWIVQYNNKIDVCGGLYPVNLRELEDNHFTWVFEPYRQQRMAGKRKGDDQLVVDTIGQVCGRLSALLEGRAGVAPITAKPEILYRSPYNFVIADEKGDPNSRLVLAAQGHTNLISVICRRPNGRFTYSIIRGSPYDEDTFRLSKLTQAFQAAEDRQDVKIWGGSGLAAGSDSEIGSSLSWQQLRDIAEPILRAAYRTNLPGRAITDDPLTRPGVLLVTAPGTRSDLQKYLADCGVDVFLVSSCAEAHKVLKLDYQIGAVFTTPRLDAGCYGELIEVARRRTHPVPVVAFLPPDDELRQPLLDAGLFSVLAEPFDPAEVHGIIATILG